LADFGLSKRIEETSTGKQYSKLFGIVPYIDSKKLADRTYKLNEMSDVYSIGVLLWEISSGQQPFYGDNVAYDIGLICEIVKGSRENPILGTPNSYVKLYKSKYIQILFTVFKYILLFNLTLVNFFFF
jgi:serine/threonine protein kinase